jgi:hypothetical protein
MRTGEGHWTVHRTETGWVASYNGTPMWLSFPDEESAWEYIESFEASLL